MYDLADHVLDWRTSGRPVQLVRIVSTRGFSSQQPAAARALSPAVPGQPAAGWDAAGSILDGAADAAIANLVDDGRSGLVTVTVTDEQAGAVGLSCGGQAELYLQDAVGIPDRFWALLRDREPCCLVDRPGTGAATEVFTAAESGPSGTVVGRLFARGDSRTTLTDVGGTPTLVTALWPVPRLVIVGEGLIAQALAEVAGLVGWDSAITDGDQSALGELRAGDGVIVLSHDLDLSGAALRQALSGPATYVGALGSRTTQQRRREWLSGHGVADQLIDTVRGPAGLDLGALTPHQIAVAITAEMMAVRNGASGAPLSERDGAIHPTGPNAPPPRHVAF